MTVVHAQTSKHSQELIIHLSSTCITSQNGNTDNLETQRGLRLFQPIFGNALTQSIFSFKRWDEHVLGIQNTCSKDIKGRSDDDGVGRKGY